MQFVITVISALLALLAISLQRTYHHLPNKELKRRARAGDPVASLLYRAVSYGPSLTLVLWMAIVLSSAAFFVLVSLSGPAWFAVFACAALVSVGFIWLPAKDVTRLSVWLAGRAAPLLAVILEILHPLLDRLARLLKRIIPAHLATGLYEKEDLLELLQRQETQSDNRIAKTELNLAMNALTISDKLVREYLTPRRVVKMVNTTDSVGPILMSELHASGYSRFPVFNQEKEQIVGTLYLRDMVNAPEGGTVDKLMRKDVYYIHEEQTLYEALDAITKTRHQLFVVVNSFEEYVGIISIEDVLKHIFGESINDEFDRYDDMRAVAALHAAKEHTEHVKDKVELPPEVPA